MDSVAPQVTSPQKKVEQAGFLRCRRPAADAPWLECFILDVSQSGICLEVGALAVPQIFAISFTSCGTVKRLCRLAWRRGEMVGARYVTAKQRRQASR
jgi:hypothetical protein